MTCLYMLGNLAVHAHAWPSMNIYTRLSRVSSVDIKPSLLTSPPLPYPLSPLPTPCPCVRLSFFLSLFLTQTFCSFYLSFLRTPFCLSLFVTYCFISFYIILSFLRMPIFLFIFLINARLSFFLSLCLAYAYLSICLTHLLGRQGQSMDCGSGIWP